MRSKISIDLDEENRSVVSITRIKSDDLKDKVVSRFTEGFDQENGWCTFNFIGEQNIPSPLSNAIHITAQEKSKLYEIKPITDKELLNEYGRMGRILMQKGKIPLPRQSKYADKRNNFSYQMFAGGEIVIETKAESILEADAAVAIVEAIRHLAEMMRNVDLNITGNQRVIPHFENLIQDLPVLLGLKSIRTYEIPYIDGKLTALKWLKTLPVTFDWNWLTHTNELVVNGVKVTDEMLKEKMLDISSSKPPLFFQPDTKEFEMLVGGNRYKFIFKGAFEE